MTQKALVQTKVVRRYTSKGDEILLLESELPDKSNWTAWKKAEARRQDEACRARALAKKGSNDTAS